MLRVSSLLLLLAITALTSACGLFNRRDVPYHEAGNQPPLQVPSDLSRPTVDDALRIPDVQSAQVRATPAAAGRAPARVSRAAGPVGTLVVADSADSVWRRVGIALERMGDDVRVLQADADAGLYQVSVSGSQRSDGMFRRMFRREQRVQEQFNLFVEPAGEGTSVRAEGGGTLARDLLRRLGERLR